METRKIQIAGGTTFTVSLPKEWAGEHDLQAGDDVRVYPHDDGSLVVRTNGHSAEAPESLTVTADGLSDATLRRRVRAGYETGRNAVELTSDDGFDDDRRETVRESAQRLLGVDVVTDCDDRIVCKSLLDTADVSIEQTLRQLQFVALSSHRDAVGALLDADGDTSPIDDRRAEATRLLALVTRQFERAMIDPGELDDLDITRSTLVDYHTAARELDRIADTASTVAAVAHRRPDDGLPDDVAASFEAHADDARELVERATNALLDGADSDRACDVLADCDDLTEDRLDGALAADAPPWIALASHCLVTTVECARSIADATLRAASRPARAKPTDE